MRHLAASSKMGLEPASVGDSGSYDRKKSKGEKTLVSKASVMSGVDATQAQCLRSFD